MADEADFGFGGAPGIAAATDHVDGKSYQRVKLDLGGDGLADPVIGALRTQLGDSLSVDAFGRERVSEPMGLFAVQCQYDAEPLLLEPIASGTGVAPAHSASTRMVALTCTAGNGTSALCSYEHVPYQPGKSQMLKATGVFGAGVAGAVVDLGVFWGDNGVMLRQNGTSGLELVRRTGTSGAAVEEVVPKANWNLGASIAIDETKDIIFFSDFQYLGMGRVRCGVSIGGVNVALHQFTHAGIIAVPYMQTLTLPVQMRVVATGTAAPKTAHFKCASVESEGGFESPSSYTFVTEEQAVAAGNETRTHLVSLRPKTTFSGIVNHSRLTVDAIDLTVTGNATVRWELCVGATFSAGPTWTSGDVNAAYSATEQTTAAGTLATPGYRIAGGYVGATASSKASISRALSSKAPLTLDYAGAQRAMGTVSLIVTGVGAASACRAMLGISELR